MPYPTFSERLAARQRVWWDTAGTVARLHRLRERRALRARNDPEEAWRCCAHWQRTLVNKWNGREFAARHGCRVPDLYWFGGVLARPPVSSLPSHFVVRPLLGTVRRGVLVISDRTELLRGERVGQGDLRRRLSPRRRMFGAGRIVIEEFVRSEDGAYRLPLEFKCHSFAGDVAAVEVIERTGPRDGTHRYYTPAWRPFPDPMHIGLPQAALREPPACLDQMLRGAATLGSRLATYARIDFFASDEGSVFNEFSSVPFRGLDYTPYCDDLFGALWAERCPDAT